MKVRHLCSMLILTILVLPPLRAADPVPPVRATDKAEEKPATPAPPAPSPDLAITRFSMSTDKPDRQNTVLHIRVENIGTAPSTHTGVIVDCRLPDKENQHCPGSAPPPRFPLPALATGEGRNFTVPLRRFLSSQGVKNRYEFRARVDTGARIQDSNRFNNFKKFEIVY